MPQTRRTFLTLASAAGVVAQISVSAESTKRVAADRLANLVVINTLGGLDDPNEPVTPNPGDAAPVLRPRVIADARASGATAINLTMGHVFGKEEPFEQTVRAVAQWDALIRANASDLLKVLTTKDIARAKAEKKIGIIYGFQNATMLGDRADRVDLFADLGVRVIQLTYNAPNALGGGSLAPDTGLTPFGREVVERLNARRVIVDLSHSGERICLDAAAASREPIAITHTGCRALVDLPRNKTDEELKAVASKGGYVGIYFMPFLAIDRKVTGDDVVAHVEHAVDVCGEDHVGIGTDGSFTQVDDLVAYQKNLEKEVASRRAAGISAPGERPDIFPFAVDLRGPDQLRQLADRLAKRGYSETRIEKILGLNFVRYAQRIWGA